MEDHVLVSDIQGYCVNDGPGFRTNVFLKGCLLRCAWCHNPETQLRSREVYWKKFKCTQCGRCLDSCPRDAISAPVSASYAQSENSGYHKIDRVRCDGCLACVDACPYGALEVVGRPMSVDAILQAVLRDKLFYDNSGGGVTITGGEPMLQAEFVTELLRRCKESGLHTCLDTSGYCDWKVLKETLQWVDLVLFDLKHIDNGVHKKITGVGNKKILENIKNAVMEKQPLWLRLPVLPGYSDTVEYHGRVIEFLDSLGGTVERIDLLPFHNYCGDKYSWLGKEWKMGELDATDPALVEYLGEAYAAAGLEITVGGSGFEPAAGSCV